MQDVQTDARLEEGPACDRVEGKPDGPVASAIDQRVPGEVDSIRFAKALRAERDSERVGVGIDVITEKARSDRRPVAISNRGAHTTDHFFAGEPKPPQSAVLKNRGHRSRAEHDGVGWRAVPDARHVHRTLNPLPGRDMQPGVRTEPNRLVRRGRCSFDRRLRRRDSRWSRS